MGQGPLNRESEPREKGTRWPQGPAAAIASLHVLAGLDAAHGGTSFCVPRLCQALADLGGETALYSVSAAGAGESESREKGYRERRFPWSGARAPLLKDFRFSAGLWRALHHGALRAAVIHNHGLWLMPNIEAGRAAERAGKPILVSPHGMLAPAALAFSRGKKRVFWALFRGAPVRRAACRHATSEQEYDEIRAFGLANPVAVIANGVDLPALSTAARAERGGERVALSLGRIHPKKGLDLLLRAWALVEGRYPQWRLRILGPAEGGHEKELRGLASVLRLERASIEGPLYGEEKEEAYRQAELFILSSRNENFGLSVAEALAAGVPAIATKGAPWSGLGREGCGWWIEQGVEPLSAALASALALPRESLKAMGGKGRAWMERDFSWDRVGREMLEVYLWLCRKAELPPTVRLV